MSVALVTRAASSVEHVGVWAYDRANSRWATGRYVPMCGQEKDHTGPWHIREGEGYEVSGVTRKRLCSRCARALAVLLQLVEPKCRVCSCTEDNGCWPGCHWIELPDPVTRRGLCSACVDFEQEAQS